MLLVAGDGAQQGLKKRRGSRVRIDPRRLVIEPNRHAAVGDLKLVRAAVEGPALVLLWIEKIEDRLVDCTVGGRLRGRIGGEVAGNAKFGSPSCREMDDN